MFRLSSASMALRRVGGDKRESVVLPANSEIEVSYLRDDVRPNTWMIDGPRVASLSRCF